MSKAPRNGLFVQYCAKDFLDGTQMLAPAEELAYRRIVDLIYASNDRLADDDKKLAWMTKAGKGWPAIKLILLDMGKIEVVDGRISNARCRSELSKSERLIAQKIGAGKASAEARNSLKDNETGSTAVGTAVPTVGQRQGQRTNNPETKELREEESSETLPGFSGAGGPSLIDRMLAIYREEAPGFAQPKGAIKPTEARGKAMLARLRNDLAGDLDQWRAFVRRCAGNRFINGSKTDWKGGRTLDWITAANNFRKIVEGHYAADDAADPSETGAVISYAEECEIRGKRLLARVLSGEFRVQNTASN